MDRKKEFSRMRAMLSKDDKAKRRTNPFAISGQDGEWYKAHDVALAVRDGKMPNDFYCPGCDGPLILKSGKIAPHFCHTKGKKCGGSRESITHQCLKRAIASLSDDWIMEHSERVGRKLYRYDVYNTKQQLAVEIVCNWKKADEAKFARMQREGKKYIAILDSASRYMAARTSAELYKVDLSQADSGHLGIMGILDSEGIEIQELLGVDNTYLFFNGVLWRAIDKDRWQLIGPDTLMQQAMSREGGAMHQFLNAFRYWRGVRQDMRKVISYNADKAEKFDRETDRLQKSLFPYRGSLPLDYENYLKSLDDLKASILEKLKKERDRLDEEKKKAPPKVRLGGSNKSDPQKPACGTADDDAERERKRREKETYRDMIHDTAEETSGDASPVPYDNLDAYDPTKADVVPVGVAVSDAEKSEALDGDMANLKEKAQQQLFTNRVRTLSPIRQVRTEIRNASWNVPYKPDATGNDAGQLLLSMEISDAKYQPSPCNYFQDNFHKPLETLAEATGLSVDEIVANPSRLHGRFIRADWCRQGRVGYYTASNFQPEELETD